jgi:hypothetical protein
MIHNPIASATRLQAGTLIDANLVPDFAPTGRHVTDSFRMTIAATTDPVYVLITRLNRPIIVKRYTYWQNTVVAGFENMDVIFDSSDKITHAANIGARLLSGAANYLGGFRPTPQPVTAVFNLPIRIRPLMIKFLFRSSAIASQIMIAHLTYELA